MVKFILKRIGTMIIAMFMIILITFTLMHSIPGGPFTNTKGVPEEVTQAMEAKYGLDQPMPVQFVKYLGNLLHGDFGPSYKYTGKTVNDFIATGAPVSAKLGLVTLVFVLLTSIPMGILAALKNGKWQDMLLMAIATIGVTIPSFVIASMLIYVFSFKLNVLPTFGLDSWKSYILPVIAMGGYSVSYLARLMRSSLLEVMGQDYILHRPRQGSDRVRRCYQACPAQCADPRHHGAWPHGGWPFDRQLCCRKDLRHSRHWLLLCKQRDPARLHHHHGRYHFLCCVPDGNGAFGRYLLLPDRPQNQV